MDPNLFHVDWERTFEALTMIIILAFIVERALAIIFETRLFIERFDKPGLKELLALGVSIAICVLWKFDAISIIILTPETTIPGYAVTGAVIAGGSKASIKLFHDVLNIKSSSYERRHEIAADKAVENAETVAREANTANNLPKLYKLSAAAKANARTAKQAAAASGSREAADAAAKAEAAAASIDSKIKSMRSDK